MVDLNASSLLLAVIVGGGVALLGILLVGLRALRTSNVEHHQDNVDQTKRLEHIEILVDGRYSEVLQELADVKRLLAKQTGEPSDKDRADQAQRRADDQANRVKAANIHKGED